MDELTIKVRVIPNAHKSSLVGMQDGVLVVRLTAPPVDGKANAALLEFLAEQLKLRKQQVQLKSGQKSRHKVVKVQGIGRAELERLVPPGSED
ncbi:YggU family protein [bacterium]|nr:YggU family protein [bacterium]